MRPYQLRSLRFSEASRIPNWSSFEDKKYASPACRRAARNYGENLLRGDVLSIGPAYAFMNGVYWKDAIVEAHRRLEVEEGAPAAIELAIQLYWHARKTTPVQRRIADFNASRESAEIAMCLDVMTHSSLRSMLEGMVIQAWAA